MIYVSIINVSGEKEKKHHRYLPIMSSPILLHLDPNHALPFHALYKRHTQTNETTDNTKDIPKRENKSQGYHLKNHQPF